MGHAIEYFSVADRKEIMQTAEEFAYYNVDRQENPSGSYHGMMTIHDDIICESYEDAIAKIDSLDSGFYDDHAVRYKDKDALKPTKQMLAEKARAEKIANDRYEYMDKHSILNRKAKFVGCKKCESKLAVEHLKSNSCPVCGAELRADYIVERLKKYDADYKKSLQKYQELKKKQTGKCPIRWAFKVEVHC